MPKQRDLPISWKERRAKIHRPWSIPFQRFEWACEWISYWFGQWAFLEVLEYAGKLTVVLGLITYIASKGERQRQAEDQRKAKHYQAWQAINLASAQSGNAGRLDALQDLNRDGQSLAGVHLANAFLNGIVLTNAMLHHADFSNSILYEAQLQGANFYRALLDKCQLSHANLQRAIFKSASLRNAALVETDVAGADFTDADLHNSILEHVKNWQQIKSLTNADLTGVVSAPVGLIELARTHGALVDSASSPGGRRQSDNPAKPDSRQTQSLPAAGRSRDGTGAVTDDGSSSQARTQTSEGAESLPDRGVGTTPTAPAYEGNTSGQTHSLPSKPTGTTTSTGSGGGPADSGSALDATNSITTKPYSPSPGKRDGGLIPPYSTTNDYSGAASGGTATASRATPASPVDTTNNISTKPYSPPPRKRQGGIIPPLSPTNDFSRSASTGPAGTTRSTSPSPSPHISSGGTTVYPPKSVPLHPPPSTGVSNRATMLHR